MKKMRINDQGMTMYVVTLNDGTKTRFWFINSGIIEELLNSYNIPFIKVDPDKKYEWDSKKSSKYWRDKYGE